MTLEIIVLACDRHKHVQYTHDQKIGRPNNLKVFGSSQPKSLNRKAKID